METNAADNTKNSQRLLEYNAVVNDAMVSLTAPLNCNFGINHFVYARFFNNKLFKISNDLEWLKFIINNKYYELDFYQEHINNLAYQPTYKVLWDYENNPIMLNAIRHYNLWHALTIYARFNDCIEMYSFATTKENSKIISLYMNDITCLERFIFYFKQKAAELINVEKKEALFLQRKELIFYHSSDSSNIRRAEFLKQTHIKRFYLAQIKIILTPRELDCLHLLYSGYSIKKSAIILNISPHTVEYYLNHLKEKLGYTYRQELLGFYQKEVKPYYKAEKSIQYEL